MAHYEPPHPDLHCLQIQYFHVNAIDLHNFCPFSPSNKSGMPIFVVYYHTDDKSTGVFKLIFHINTGKVLFYYYIQELFTTNNKIHLLIQHKISNFQLHMDKHSINIGSKIVFSDTIRTQLFKANKIVSYQVVEFSNALFLKKLSFLAKRVQKAHARASYRFFSAKNITAIGFVSTVKLNF